MMMEEMEDLTVPFFFDFGKGALECEPIVQPPKCRNVRRCSRGLWVLFLIVGM